jgi:hypothetical protein
VQLKHREPDFKVKAVPLRGDREPSQLSSAKVTNSNIKGAVARENLFLLFYPFYLGNQI